jgi:hypothetical protein
MMTAATPAGPITRRGRRLRGRAVATGHQGDQITS